nr:hypothetical protein Q903MT_gene4603 [Picea sitchensis]
MVTYVMKGKIDHPNLTVQVSDWLKYPGPLPQALSRNVGKTLIPLSLHFLKPQVSPIAGDKWVL